MDHVLHAAENTMTYLMAQFTVQDFDTWRFAFEDAREMREDHGSQGGHVFRSADDPNEVTVLLEWESRDAAQAFASSEELREARKRAGVQEPLTTRFLDKVQDTPS